VSGPDFMFCSSGLVFGTTEGVGCRFHRLRSRTRFRQYRGRPFPFSCFSLPDIFSAVLRASDPVFIFYTPRLVFGGTEGVGSRFHVLRSQTHFRRYRGRRVSFSGFVLSDSLSTAPRTSGPVFMFCALILVFGGTEGVPSHFHVFAPGHICGGTKGVTSRLHILLARTHFWQYRGRKIPFFCFALPDSFSAVPWALGPVFMFLHPDSFSAVSRS
jgi:hypothetical protein